MADRLGETLRKLRALGEDRRSGAAEIADRAAAVVEEFCAPQADGDDRRPEALTLLAETLLDIHPSMAPLLNLANRIQLAAERRNGARPQLRRELARLRRQRRHTSRKIARRFAARLPRRATVLTYSYSSTVVAALLAGKPRLERVIVSEGRPGYEGRAVAERLAAKGIRVTLVIDAALPRELDHAHLAVVGADAVLPRAYVNKVGTRLLQSEARARRKPFFVLADTAKFLPRALARFHRLEEQPAQLLWREPPAGVKLLNRVFETVPFGPRVTLLSERGPLTPRRVRNWLGRQPVARRWRTASRRKRS